MTFNFGVFMGYAAITNSVSMTVCLPLYIGAILWTIVYDTIYAYQDVEHDKSLGLRSAAITFGNSPKPILAGLATGSMLSIGMAGVLAGLHPSFYAFLGAASIHYLW